MKLNTYIKRFSPQERAALAQRLGTSIGHMNNVAYEQRVASAALTRQIAIESRREVAEWDLRPHDWFLIWPELVGTNGAPRAVGRGAPTPRSADMAAVVEASHAG